MPSGQFLSSASSWFGLSPRRPLLGSARFAALLLVVGTSLTLAESASAQTTITFSGAQTITADSDVLTTGTTFVAVNLHNTTYSVSDTVNGITFKDYYPGSSALSIGGLSTTFNGFSSTITPFKDLSSDYRDLLSGAEYVADPTINHSQTFTITGLTAGNQYEAQFFVSDPRIYGVGRFDTLTGGAKLLYNTTGVDGGVGQFANSNVFTADASGLASFVLTGGFSPTQGEFVTQANAFQVRDLGAAPVPEASTTVSFGLLLLLGLGGVAVATKKKKAAAA